jgi:hypothetical protein
MDTKRVEIVRRCGSLLAALLVAIALCFGSAGRAAQVDAPPPKEIDARAVIELLSNALAEGRRDTFTDLSRLGFTAEVEELRKLDGNPLYAFSSQTIIENLYRRAEIQGEGEGDRFLAVLYNNAAQRSAALAIDPELGTLRTFTADQLDLQKNPIKFSSLQAISDINMRPSLSQAADKAIVKLAEVYSGRGLAQARVAILKNFQKQGFDGRAFEQALADTKTTEAALRRLVELGTPPPPAETALRGVLHDTIAGSAALSVDRGALEIMEELSGNLPTEIERYIKAEDRLESRKLQIAEAAKVKRPGKTRPNREPVLLGRLGDEAPQRPSGGNNSGGGVGSGTGKKGGPPHPTSSSGMKPAESGRFARAYDNYTRQTFESRFEPHRTTQTYRRTGTPRSYRFAIRSARAARGIALGGKVRSEIKAAPVRAIWLANRKDDRFGRLFVQFSSAKGKPSLVGASRVLFADSFYAASSILWGRHGDEASFRDGEILLLMSMDPESPVLREASKVAMREALKSLGVVEHQQVEKALEDLKTASAQARVRADDRRALIRFMILQERFDQTFRQALAKLDPAKRKKVEDDLRRLRVTRGVVTHPAIFGRELAWSAVRIDFGFNRMDRLSKESAMMNGGRSIPASLRNLPLSKASTWQFFEQDSLIQLGPLEGRARRLEVISRLTGDSAPGNPRNRSRSHFGISMFGKNAPPGSQRVEDELYRLEGLETEVQPLLDWLATNHHDFMRLNDLSEAFSLLRWLRSKHAQIIIMDMNGQGNAIATPDRVEIGYGPRVGGK